MRSNFGWLIESVDLLDVAVFYSGAGHGDADGVAGLGGAGVAGRFSSEGVSESLRESVASLGGRQVFVVSVVALGLFALFFAI